MGSKNKPGKFDCYAAAEPDEPMFVLLGRDPTASLIVRLWARLREVLHPYEDAEKIAEARACAEAMEGWAREHGKGEKVDRAELAWTNMLARVGEAYACIEDFVRKRG